MKQRLTAVALLITGMAFGQMTPKEELDVMNDSVYTFPSAQYTLDQVIRQAAVGEAAAFIATQKDTSADPVAEGYRGKMVRIARLLQERPGRVTGELTRVFVAYLGTQFTYAQVTNATEAQWVTVIENNVERVLEIVAGVTPAERAAYNAL